MSKIPVVFFGSGPVAAKSLELLLSDFEVVAVVTKPKPSHHRGSFPVIDVAVRNNLHIHTVTNKKEVSDLIASTPFRTDVAILIDFGIIIAQDVIDYFPKGIVNSHFSLLPELRGADPISFAILSGQAQTGVSLMLLVVAMDEGPVLACGVQELDGTETTPQLTDSLINLSDNLLKSELPRYMQGESKAVEQSQLSTLIPNHPQKPSYSHKLTKQDGELDFSKPAEVLERQIRAYVEWPKNHTKFNDLDVVIITAHVASANGSAGTREVIGKELYVYCSKDALVIDTLKPAGKSVMDALSFINGYGKYI